MPYGTSALSPHVLFSEYRGPRILNDASAGANPPPPGEGGTPPPNPASNPPPPPKGDDTEGRITDLSTKNKELKIKLKEYEDAEKKRKEDEALQRGEHEKVIKEKDTELTTLKGEHEVNSKKLTAYEKAAKDHVAKALESIKDEKKKAAVLKLLDGREPLDQFSLLPEALELAGASGNGSFGGGTPEGTPPDKSEAERKKARLDELIDKEMKGTSLTPKERKEKYDLTNEAMAKNTWDTKK